MRNTEYHLVQVLSRGSAGGGRSAVEVLLSKCCSPLVLFVCMEIGGSQQDLVVYVVQ